MSKKMIQALALLAIVVALLMGVGAVWLTGEVLMFPLGVMPIALTGTGIVAYRELQTKRRFQALEEAGLDADLDEAPAPGRMKTRVLANVRSTRNGS